MKYGTVCSGIESTSVAFHQLGWEPVFFSEISEYQSKVLEKNWPGVENFGDFTKINVNNLKDIDLLAGGTPCQSFSMLGNREGLSSENGNLCLQFVNLIDKIDNAKRRTIEDYPKESRDLSKESRVNPILNWVVWENVVGCLSSRDNAFGCLLAGISGEKEPYNSGYKKGSWPKAGYVNGKKRNIAWRVLDSRYFGVPQGRKRVFVVANPVGHKYHPREVLFERDSYQGDIEAFRRKQEEEQRDFIVTNDWGAINKRGVLATMRASNSCVNVIIKKGERMRRLHPIEMERAMGFPDDYTLINGDENEFIKRYECCGNSMAVPVVKWIADRIEKYS